MTDPACVLRTERLLLVPLDHVEAAALLGESEPVRPRCEGFPRADDLDISRIVLAGDAAPTVFGPRIMVLRETGEDVGTIGWYGPPVDGVLAVGYGIAAPRRRQGLVSEALRALLASVSGLEGVREAWADVEHANTDSHHVLTACGFVRSPSEDTDEVMIFRRPL